jgi:hypothetical protein
MGAFAPGCEINTEARREREKGEGEEESDITAHSQSNCT